MSVCDDCDDYQGDDCECRLLLWERTAELEADNAELRGAIPWLRDEIGKGYCERHPDVEPLRAWGCPDCLVDAKGANAELRGALEVFAGFGRDALGADDGPLWTVAQIGDNALVVEAFREAQRAIDRPSGGTVLLAAKALADAVHWDPATRSRCPICERYPILSAGGRVADCRGDCELALYRAALAAEKGE